MSLDPYARASWRGLMELLRPPVGFRLKTAVGTSFGMSFDTLVAALLAMVDSDAEELVQDPLAGLLATTRLSARVRILVQAGTISGSTIGIPSRLAGLLDRMIVPVRMPAGLFHPKIWVVCHSPAVSGSKESDRVRVIVGSRNLVRSNALELGAVIDGSVNGNATLFAQDLANALKECFKLANPNCRAVSELPGLIQQSEFEIPDEGTDSLRLRWQGQGLSNHVAHLPRSLKRVLVVSPFLTADFINLLLDRSETLRLVSTPMAFRKLDEGTFASLGERADRQGSPTMFVVGDDFGDDDTARLEGVHAKLVVVDQGTGSDSVSFIGSANATAAGWGVNRPGNMECLLEFHPGIAMDRFVREFLSEKKDKLKPWIKEFEAEDRTPLSIEEQLEDRLNTLIRELAAKRFIVRYDALTKVLTVALIDNQTALPAKFDEDGIQFDFVPLGVLEDMPQWSEVAELYRGEVEFIDVDLSAVSAFIVIRATHAKNPPVFRIAFAALDLTIADLNARDHAAREHLIANARTEDILAALVFGISRLSPTRSRLQTRSGGSKHPTTAEVLADVSLERMLRAVAENPDLLREIQLLLGGRTDSVFAQFQDDLRAVIGSANDTRP